MITNKLVDMGRLMYAIEMYKKRKASIGRVAEIAGLSISETMDLFAELGIKSNITYEDYLEGLKNLRKHW